MSYVFKVLNPDGSDFKLYPEARYLKVTVEADTLEQAEQLALTQVRGYLGPNFEFSVLYMPEGLQ